jgi:hypothetical protein
MAGPTRRYDARRDASRSEAAGVMRRMSLGSRGRATMFEGAFQRQLLRQQ